MQTAIAQIAALTTYGNAFLQGKTDGNDFQTANSTFNHCEYVDFLEVVPDPSNRKEQVWAANPREWLERLKVDGVRQIKLWHGSSGGKDVADRMLVGLWVAAADGSSKHGEPTNPTFGKLDGRWEITRGPIRRSGESPTSG